MHYVPTTPQRLYIEVFETKVMKLQVFGCSSPASVEVDSLAGLSTEAEAERAFWTTTKPVPVILTTEKATLVSHANPDAEE